MDTCTLPEDALLRRYADGSGHVDCYVAEVALDVGLARYVEAFYTGRVFKLERLLLRWFAHRPSTDADARAVARGERAAFAAWTVEARDPHQLLMCDMLGRTRSWFMVAPGAVAGTPGTRLYFGSAVVPVRDPRSGELRMGGIFRALLGFHRLYSRVLLSAARSRVLRGLPAAPGVR